jgi:hypothetical protein
MRKINPTWQLEKEVRAKLVTNPDPVAHPEWGAGKYKNNFSIGPEHPDYQALFDSAFSAGMSFPARLIKNPQKVAVKESPMPQTAPDPSSPSHEHQEDTEQSSANHQRGSWTR